MPAVSQKQRAWAFGVKGKAWAEAHHFDNKGPLPKYAGKAKAKRKKAKKKSPTYRSTTRRG